MRAKKNIYIYYFNQPVIKIIHTCLSLSLSFTLISSLNISLKLTLSLRSVTPASHSLTLSFRSLTLLTPVSHFGFSLSQLRSPKPPINLRPMPPSASNPHRQLECLLVDIGYLTGKPWNSSTHPFCRPSLSM